MSSLLFKFGRIEEFSLMMYTPDSDQELMEVSGQAEEASISYQPTLIGEENLVLQSRDSLPVQICMQTVPAVNRFAKVMTSLGSSAVSTGDASNGGMPATEADQFGLVSMPGTFAAVLLALVGVGSVGVVSADELTMVLVTMHMINQGKPTWDEEVAFIVIERDHVEKDSVVHRREAVQTQAHRPCLCPTG